MQGFDDRTQKNKQQDASRQPKGDTLLHAALLAQLREEYGSDAASERDEAAAGAAHEFSPAFKERIASLIAQADVPAEDRRESGAEEMKQAEDDVLSMDALHEETQKKEEKERARKVISRDTLAARRMAREEQRKRAREAGERMAGDLLAFSPKREHAAQRQAERISGRSARRHHARSLVQAASVLLILGLFVFGAERTGFLRGRGGQSAVQMEAAADRQNRAIVPAAGNAASDGANAELPAMADAPVADAKAAPYGAEDGSAYKPFSERIARERSAEPLPGTAGRDDLQPEAEGQTGDAPVPAAAGPDEADSGTVRAGGKMTAAAEPDTENLQLPNTIQEVSGPESFEEQLGLIVPFGTAYRTDIRCSIIDGETAQIQYYSENLRSEVSYRAGKAARFYDAVETKEDNSGTDTSSAGADDGETDEIKAGRKLAGVYDTFDESLTEHWGAYWSGVAAGVLDPKNAGLNKSTGYMDVTVCFPKGESAAGALAVWQIDDILYSLWVSDTSYAPDAVGKEAVSLIETGA